MANLHPSLFNPALYRYICILSLPFAVMSSVPMPPLSSPVLAEITRGALVESRHVGAAVVVDATGGIVAEWGDSARVTYPRSSNKILQALPLIESGAADYFALSKAELALACASHRGEARHVKTVQAWLARLGLSDQNLECGSHWPFDEAAMIDLARSGATPTAAHNNCSGKHSGFLTTAVHLGEPLAGYVGYDHPVQRRITETLSEMLEVDLFTAPWGADGCGIPTIAAPLKSLALAMAKCADPSRLPERRADAVRRLVDAMATEAFFVDGTLGFATRLMAVMGDSIVCKIGAEGLFTAIIRDKGWGIALKIEDGAARAAEVALGGILCHLGLLREDQQRTLASLLTVPVKTRAALHVGDLRAADLGAPGAF